MRKADIIRKTNETEISINLNIDGVGNRKIQTSNKFFNHMLEQLVAHGQFDIELVGNSLDGDCHHLIEDVAITLGEAFKKALSDKKGINRYGSFLLPMDEALTLCVIDISGRPFCKISAEIKEEMVSDFPSVLVSHFFSSFASALGATIHIKVLEGIDGHHIIESIFKSFARALNIATAINNEQKDKIPSTKGLL